MHIPGVEECPDRDPGPPYRPSLQCQNNHTATQTISPAPASVPSAETVCDGARRFNRRISPASAEDQRCEPLQAYLLFCVLDDLPFP